MLGPRLVSVPTPGDFITGFFCAVKLASVYNVCVRVCVRARVRLRKCVALERLGLIAMGGVAH